MQDEYLNKANLNIEIHFIYYESYNVNHSFSVLSHDFILNSVNNLDILKTES